MTTREILSLQFGHYSNFVGAHWWNIQDTSFDYSQSSPSEINHDVLWREGLNAAGKVTYTPRLLLVDLKGSLKTLPEGGSLYKPTPEPDKAAAIWDQNKVEVKANEPEVKNDYQEDLENPLSSVPKNYDLARSVQVWSDFLYTRFHPRTVNIVRTYQHDNKNSQFDVFPLGQDLWKSEPFGDDFSDKIRSYIEECDYFQGFHVTLDATNAFAGLASSCMEHLKDDYTQKSILAFPLIPAHYLDYVCETEEERHESLVKDAIRVLNVALCFDSLNEFSSLFSPLCTSRNGWRQPGPKQEFYHVSYDHTLPYHTSSILAAALDTITLRHRLKDTQFSVSDLCVDLNVHGKKAAAASLCLPFSLNKGADFIDCLNNWEGPLTQTITPSCNLGTDKMTQIFSLRGIPETRLKRPMKQAGNQRDMPAYNCNTVNEMLSFYLSCNYFVTLNNITTVAKGMSVKTPYPKIFDPYVGIDGNINADPRLQDFNVETVPVLAGLHSGKGVGDMVETLHTETKKIKFARLHHFKAAGLESQEFEECLDRLFDLREVYEENYNI